MTASPRPVSDAATLAEKVKRAMIRPVPERGWVAPGSFPEIEQAWAAFAELVRLAESAAGHGDPCPGCEICELAVELIDAREDAAGWEATARQLAEAGRRACNAPRVRANTERRAAHEQLRAALVVYDQAAEK